jgi:diadenosine tetraphosphate (Ap4A) HIT family hydrolase
MIQNRETRRKYDIKQRYDEDRVRLRSQHDGVLPCAFCDSRRRRQLESTETMMVVRNDYPYEYFDGRYIKDHFLIVPRRHVAVMNSFTPEERSEYQQLLSKYQLLGYANFTRSAGDEVRSVPLHLHTHLFSYQD